MFEAFREVFWLLLLLFLFGVILLERDAITIDHPYLVLYQTASNGYSVEVFTTPPPGLAEVSSAVQGLLVMRDMTTLITIDGEQQQPLAVPSAPTPTPSENISTVAGLIPATGTLGVLETTLSLSSLTIPSPSLTTVAVPSEPSASFIETVSTVGGDVTTAMIQPFPITSTTITTVRADGNGEHVPTLTMASGADRGYKGRCQGMFVLGPSLALAVSLWAVILG